MRRLALVVVLVFLLVIAGAHVTRGIFWDLPQHMIIGVAHG